MHAALDQHGTNYKEGLKRAVLSFAVFAVLAAPARAAEQIPVVVAPADVPFPAGGAVGLLVPGDGETVSGESARAALVRGKTRKSLLGGAPGGKPLITVARRPGPVTIYVSLPPPGTHPNTRRYPIAIVGDGWHGILESPSTRIRGLVSIADVAPTALGKHRITASPDPDAHGELERLDTRLRHQHDGRNWAVAILALSVLAGSIVALAFRSRGAARAAVLAAPVSVAGAIVLSAAGGARPIVLVPLLAGIVVAVCIGGAALLRNRRVIAVFFVALITAYLVVLAARPEWTALATIGPNPSEGGRFYGSSNLTTTVLVTVALYAAASLGLRWLLGVALLTMVTVGWSKAGADGGGLVVVVAAFAALAALLARGRLTARTTAAVAGGAAALALALVGLDAATGGHSHVTRRVGEGPGAVLDELGNRLHISAERITSSWHAALVFAIGLAALAVLATRRPRFPAGDALLLATIVSLIVNDSPSDVVAGASISYGVLWTYERVHSRAWSAAR
jgi:hypothetical protein